MSTLKTNTISNVAGTKTVPTDTVVDGSAKAWVNFNGVGTVAIRQAFNVSSITDSGVGTYVVNFTSALPDADYAVVVGAINAGSNLDSTNNITTRATSNFGFQHIEAGAVADSSVLMAAVFR